MAGLNNFLSDSQQTQTTLPSWYDTAQQNVVKGGQAALSAAPSLGQTTAQGAINTLQGAQNPFTQAQGTLNQIATGAANPWITDASGNVTPNTNTAAAIAATPKLKVNSLTNYYQANTRHQYKLERLAQASLVVCVARLQ